MREEHHLLFPYPEIDMHFEQSFCEHVPKLDKPTCQELSLLGFSPDNVDIVVSSANSRRRPRGVRCRLIRSSLPAGSFRRISEHVLVSSSELVMMQMGAHVSFSFERLIMLGYGITGGFALVPQQNGSNMLVQIAPRSTLTQLTNYFDGIECLNSNEAHRPQGLKRARKALKYVYGSVESPQEARLAMLEFLPYKLGGNNVRPPVCNGEIVLPEKIMRTAGRNSFRGDFVWKKPKVVLEYNGAFHGEVREVRRDAEKYNALRAYDYEVLIATSEHVFYDLHTDSLADQLRNAIGQRASRPGADFRERRMRLRREIGALR